MKKVVELVMFNKDNKVIMRKVFDNKMIKGLAQIKRIDELEYDADAWVRLNEQLVDITNKFANRFNKEVHHFIIYNDYSESYDLYNIDNNVPVRSF